MSVRSSAWGAVLCVLALATPAHAHETRPGFLELREQGRGLYDVLWKKPSGGEIVPMRVIPVDGAGGSRWGRPERARWGAEGIPYGVYCFGNGDTIEIRHV